MRRMQYRLLGGVMSVLIAFSSVGLTASAQEIEEVVSFVEEMPEVTQEAIVESQEDEDGLSYYEDEYEGTVDEDSSEEENSDSEVTDSVEENAEEVISNEEISEEDISEGSELLAVQPTETGINLNANGGKFKIGDETATTSLTQYIGEINRPSREGYTFLGWFAESECKTCLSYNEAPDHLMKLPTAGTTIYAGWTNDYYTIKYVFNSEDESSPCATGYYYYGNGGGTDNMRRVTEYELIIPKGEAIGTKYCPDQMYIRNTDYHYSHNFWYTDPERRHTAAYSIKELVPESNMTLYAGYTRAYDVVTFVANDETASFPRECYNYNENGGDTFAKMFMPISGNDRRSITSLPSSEYYVSNTDVRKHFTGWFLDQECTEPLTADDEGYVSFDKDTTLYAGWDESNHVVSFDPNGGFFYDSRETGKSTDPVQIGTDGSSKYFSVGFIFNEDLHKQIQGWSRSAEATTPDPGLEIDTSYSGYISSAGLQMSGISEDITLYAVWKDIYHVATLVIDGGSFKTQIPWGEAKTVTDGSAEVCAYNNNRIPNPAVDSPEASGERKIFIGWKADGSTQVITQQDLFSLELTKDTTFTAQFADAINITYDANGGWLSKGAYVGDEQPTVITKKTEKVRANYRVRLLYPGNDSGETFTGWYLEKSFKTKVHDNGNIQYYKTGNTDLNLYARWGDAPGEEEEDPVEEGTFKIDYVLNGGTNHPLNVTSYKAGDVVTLKDPTRAGYTFGGWFNDEQLSNKVTTLDTSAGRDYTVYAKWIPISYSIRLNFNPPSGKNKAKTYKVAYDQPLNVKNTYSIVGYSFVNWTTNPDGTGRAFEDNEAVEGLTDTLNGAVDLYAQWKSVDYVVFFDAGADDAVSGSLKIGGTSLSDVTASQLSGMGIDISSVDSSKGYLQVLRYGEDFVLSGDEFVRPGYTLTGWVDSRTKKKVNNGTIKSLTKKQELITFTAQWKQNTYKVTYTTYGGKLSKKGIASYTVDTPKTYLPTAEDITKPGSTFLGWYSGIVGDEQVYEYVGGDVLKNLNLQAKWKAAEYTVILDGNGGTQVEASPVTQVTLEYGQRFTLSKTIYERNGFTLDSWNTAPDGTGKKITPSGTIFNMTDVDGSVITLYAQWKPVINILSYDLDGGRLPNKVVKYLADQDTVITSPTKNGYKFTGWTVSGEHVTVSEREKDGKTEYYIAANSGNYGPAKLTANFEEIHYGITIHYNRFDDDKTLVVYPADENGIAYNTDVSMQELALYALSHGWDDARMIDDFSTGAKIGTTYSISTAASKLTSVDGSMVDLYARWGNYTYYPITYVTNGGTVSKAVYAYDGTRDVTIPKAVKKGFVFKGWNVYKPDTVETSVSGLTVKIKKGSKGDVTLTAVFEPLTYSITIDPNATNASVKKYKMNGTYAYDSAVPLPEITRPGYVFEGYYLDKKLTGKRYFTTGGLTEKTSVTLYAKWSPETYTITYTGAEGVQNLNQVYVSPAKKYTLKKLTKEGYKFNGWKLAIPETENIKVAKDRSGHVTAVNILNASDLILEADWEENSYNLKFNSNGGKREGEKKAINVSLGKVLYTADANEVAKLKEDYIDKKLVQDGCLLKGFALDKGGRTMIMDAKGKFTAEYADGLRKLAVKNNATVTIYAVWENVSYIYPEISSAVLSGDKITVNIKDGGYSEYSTFVIECSESMTFRQSLTDVIENITTNTAVIDARTKKGTNYVRVRQVITDSKGVVRESKWSQRVLVK